MRIQLDYYHPWTNSLGFYWLREVGDPVEGRPWSDLDLRVADGRRGDALDALAAGTADWAISYPNRVLARAAEGLDMVAVAALNQVPLESVIVAESRSLRSFADLRGARIGYRRSLRMAKLGPMLALHRLDFAWSLLDYYATVERSTERAAWCRDVFLQAHPRRLASPAGAAVIDAVTSASR
jgi:hypothetical protein